MGKFKQINYYNIMLIFIKREFLLTMFHLEGLTLQSLKSEQSNKIPQFWLKNATEAVLSGVILSKHWYHVHAAHLVLN